MVDPGNFKNCTKNVLKVSGRKKGKIFMKIILLVFKKKFPNPCFKQVDQILDLLKN